MTVEEAATIVHHDEVVERAPEPTMVDESERSGTAGQGDHDASQRGSGSNPAMTTDFSNGKVQMISQEE